MFFLLITDGDSSVVTVRNYSFFFSQHIDESLYHLRKRLHDFPDQHSSSLILDTIFITKIGAHDPDLITKHPTIDESFYKYFIGLSPPCGKPWEGVKKVYTPFNIDNKHWVALEIQLDSKHIIVYDSQCDYYKEEVIA